MEEGMAPEEVQWLGGELLTQIDVGQGRVDELRAAVKDVFAQVTRLQDNQELVVRQKQLLEGQQEAIQGVKAMAAGLQADNEAMRVEHAQLKKIRERAARLTAEQTAVEQRHRTQLENQAELVASMKQDFLALSVENSELRRQVLDGKKVEDELRVVKLEMHEQGLAHQDALRALERSHLDAEQADRSSVQEEMERFKKQAKEQRFKLLRAQQQQTHLEEELSAKAAECATLSEESTKRNLEYKEVSIELARLKETHGELQALSKRQADMHAAMPSVVQAEALKAKEQELITVRQAKDEELAAMRARLEAVEAEQREAHLEVLKKEHALHEKGLALKRRMDEVSVDAARLRQQALEDGERADALAAKLAITEANLATKDELLRTRTERLRLLSASGVPAGSDDAASPRAAAAAQAAHELAARLQEEMDAVKASHRTLEKHAKQQGDALRAVTSERSVLQAKVSDLHAKLEIFLAESPQRDSDARDDTVEPLSEDADATQADASGVPDSV
eukprot:TRINITY_DN25464_c0_g1_i1.p1 TRINITY_DN25464_c0_g1~~TRINITY_DN25464_c0_g1_i1.p1  ORF type:complete len:509 (+),score=225.82 TRINITY_DN25464_c0_g1_i1:50-1576(+)